METGQVATCAQQNAQCVLFLPSRFTSERLARRSVCESAQRQKDEDVYCSIGSNNGKTRKIAVIFTKRSFFSFIYVFDGDGF